MTRRAVFAVLADGDVRSSRTNSGVASALFAALLRDDRVEAAYPVDVSLSAQQRIAIRLLSVRPTQYQWNRAAGWGLARPLMRSLRRSFSLRGFDRKQQVALHIRNFYFPSRYPYAPFVDTTLSLRERDWPEPELRRRHYMLLQFLERHYFSKAAHVFTASEYVRAEIIERYAISPDKVTSVGAGLNESIRSRAIRKEQGQSATLRILFVGKEFQRKGGHLLVQAFRELQKVRTDCELHIVGPADKSCGGQGVVAHGQVSDPDYLAQIYSEADIFCLPALFEPYGLVVLEAMAFGLPCVVSDVGALPSIVRSAGSGVVVPANDVLRLTGALSQLLNDADLRNRFGTDGRQTAVSMTWEAVATRIIDTLGCCGSDRQRSP